MEDLGALVLPLLIVLFLYGFLMGVLKRMVPNVEQEPLFNLRIIKNILLVGIVVKRPTLKVSCWPFG